MALPPVVKHEYECLLIENDITQIEAILDHFAGTGIVT